MDTNKKVKVVAVLNAYKKVLKQKFWDAEDGSAEEMVIEADLRKVKEAIAIVRED